VAELALQLKLSTEEAALGIIQLANEHMAQALRVMSVQRGIDPRQLTLVSFGGAGGLHVCALADALDMKRAMVPVQAGVLSALGMLVAPRTRQLSHTVGMPFSDCDDRTITKRFIPLVEQGQQALIAEGVELDEIHINYSLDVRYLGQAYYLNVPWSTLQQAAHAFHALHEQCYGHALDVPLELVNIRVALSCESHTTLDFTQQSTEPGIHTPQTGVVQLAGLSEPVSVVARHQLRAGEVLTGPVLVTEKISTTYVMPGWQANVDKMGNLLLSSQ
jgi:N-methylhydantoinase A